MGGSSSSCGTCNARICNYHKSGGYGIKNAAAIINTDTQKKELGTVLTAFVNDTTSPLQYFRTGVDPSSNGSSQAALNALRNKITSATPIVGLKIKPFCVDIKNSYTEGFVAEPFTLNGSESRVYSIISCVLIGIILLIFIGYLVYRYIMCPCRKRREKELQEAEKALEYIT